MQFPSYFFCQFQISAIHIIYIRLTDLKIYCYLLLYKKDYYIHNSPFCIQFGSLYLLCVYDLAEVLFATL